MVTDWMACGSLNTLSCKRPSLFVLKSPCHITSRRGVHLRPHLYCPSIMVDQHDTDALASLAKTIRAELQQKLSSEARIHLPFDEDKTDFDKANLRFTQYERPTYLAVVDPGCENDVVEVVKYAREKGIPFTPRGGHHAVTTTMRHFQNGICINMRPLNQMGWDAEKRHVTVGGGAITDEFVRFVHDLGMEVSKCNNIFAESGSTYKAGRCRVMSYDWCHWRGLWCRAWAFARQVWLSKRQHGFLQARTRRRKCGSCIQELASGSILGHPWCWP